MKTFISALIFVLSPVAFAQNSFDGIRLFSVQAAQFAPEHFSNFNSGTVAIDYNKNIVTLTVAESVPCPTGQVCTMMVQPPTVQEFPILSITQKHCGIREVHAAQGDRNSYGPVKTILVADASDVFCRTLALFQSTAEYETLHLDPASGERTSVRSSMLLSPVSENAQ